MKIHPAIHGLSILLLLRGAALAAPATPFSAELVEVREGQTQTGTFSFQDQSYRYETTQKGRPLVVILDGPKGVMRVLLPSEKIFFEGPADGPMALWENPFAAYAHYVRAGQVRAEGQEPVAGVACTKQVASAPEQLFLTAWVSDELGFPLKVVHPLPGRTVELRNLKRGPQDPALFAVPAGYRQPEPRAEERPAPAWAGQLARAPLLEPPFEKSLAEGATVRVRPLAGRKLEMRGTNTGQGEGTFTAQAFKGGKPSDDASAVTIQAGDTVGMTMGEDPAGSDAIAIHVDQGQVKLKVSHRAGEPSTPAAPGAEAAGAAPEVSAELTAPPSADIAARVEVAWRGPGDKDDYIALALPAHPPGRNVGRASVREGNPVKLWAPGDPGEYELRYIAGRGTKVLAKVPITVNAVAAEVLPTSPVNAAGWIEVKWKGPAAEGDFLSVARAGQAPGASVSRAAVRSGNPVRLRAPGEPGDYEVRYILGRGAKLLAHDAVSVTAVTATVEVPAAAAAGAEFEVRWQGPGYDDDYLAVARTDQPSGASLSTAKVRSSRVQLHAPKVPGTYEVRYILGYGKLLLAKKTFTVEAAPP